MRPDVPHHSEIAAPPALYVQHVDAKRRPQAVGVYGVTQSECSHFSLFIHNYAGRE